MPGKIPENILDDILNRVDIVEVISGCMPLKKAGRNFKANCPFHHEKTPSFMVSPDRQIYHCFGCGESGNAFKFLMRYERLEFPEAVEALAKKAGVSLPQQSSSEASRQEGLSALIYKINESAAEFYGRILHSQEGAAAKAYLLKRGVSEESLKTFKLGLAPSKWDALLNYLRGKSFDLSLIEKAGLLLPKQQGGYYDRFRNRIIFPIHDVKSRIIGFGARVMDNSLPKYINSPETSVYTKGRNLFGLCLSKDSIRENDAAVVVEGYLDFIIPFQEGMTNIVASSGTALTLEQVRLLKRYSHNVVIVYDGDSAGELATLRSLDIFLEEEINVKVVSLPKGFDPDSFLRKHGVDQLRTKVSLAQDLFDYKFKVLKERFTSGGVNAKVSISSAMLQTIKLVKNAVLRSEYIKKLAEELDVKEDALLQEIKKIKPEKPYEEPTHAKSVKPFCMSPTEKLLISLMLEERSLIERIRNSLEPADFRDETASRLVSIMFDLVGQGKEIEPHILMNHLTDAQASQIICESAFFPEGLSEEHKEKVVDDCIRRLKGEKARLKREHLHSQIKTAQSLGDESALNRLMEEFHYLVKKR